MSLRGAVSRRYTKVRFIQFALAIIVLAIGLLVATGQISGTIFWPTLLGLIIPTLFAEPFFTAPRTALATAAAQFGAYFSSDQRGENPLWVALLITSGLVLASSIVAQLRDEKPGQFFHWVSTRLGRAIVLGSIVSSILVLQVADTNIGDASQLAVVLGIVYGLLFLDWARLSLFPSRLQPEVATVTAVLAPNQLLIRSYARLEVSTLVSIAGPAGSCDGYVAEDLASGSGSQYRVVLDEHWRTVTDGGDAPCIIRVADSGELTPRAFAIEGSNETSIRVNPTSDLKIGETLELRGNGSPLLYQVIGLTLEAETWSTSSALVPRARLMQVGSVGGGGMISAQPTLPKPFAPLYPATETEVELDTDKFLRIGRLKGTNVPVGIRKDWMSNHGHLAILGMSGMGKTTVAAKVPTLVHDDSTFVIMDETSEYRTRLDFDVKAIGALDWSAPGAVVTEPGGEMPLQCEAVINAAMGAAHAEYESGDQPRRRYILLEEAHGWLPEWNFTSRPNADAVNRSCRYILQARKFNLTFVIISQRTAVISKSAISQCENYIIFRTLDQTSLEYVEGVIGLDLKGLVSELQRYEAICVGPLFNADAPIIVSLDPGVVPTP